MAREGVRWRSVRGFPGYEVSDHGGVRSVPRVSAQQNRTQFFSGRELSILDNGNGYDYVTLWVHMVGTKKFVHTLVAEAFSGLVPGLQVDHIDGNPRNNHYLNLRPSSQTQNMHNRRKDIDNKSGVKGVFQNPSGRFQAKITAYGKRKTIGTFDTLAEAASARAKAAEELHGEFVRHE